MYNLLLDEDGFAGWKIERGYVYVCLPTKVVQSK